MDAIFNLPTDMKLHWNVIKFTCGLLVDSSLLIERICEQFVDVLKDTTFDVCPEKSYQFLYNYTYLADLAQEKSSSSVDPFRNSVIYCMNSRYSVLRENCKSFYFYGTDRFEYYGPYFMTTAQQVAKCEAEPCTVFIRETRDSPFFMQTAQRAISQIKQPINCLIIDGATLADLFQATPMYNPEAFSKNPTEVRILLDFSDNAIVRFTACDFKGKYLNLFVDSINRCRTLQSFELVYCWNVDEKLISQLGQNQNLTTLTVRQCYGRGLSPDGQRKLNKQIKFMRKLTHLVIHDMHLNIASVQSTCLRVVSLCGCQIYPHAGLDLMTHLAKCPIEKLELNNNRFDGTFKKLCKLPGISYPHLESLSFLTEEDTERNDLCGIAHLLHNDKLPVLKQIVLKAHEHQCTERKKPTEGFVTSCRLYRNGQCKVVQTQNTVATLFVLSLFWQLLCRRYGGSRFPTTNVNLCFSG